MDKVEVTMDQLKRIAEEITLGRALANASVDSWSGYEQAQEEHIKALGQIDSIADAQSVLNFILD